MAVYTGVYNHVDIHKQEINGFNAGKYSNDDLKKKVY